MPFALREPNRSGGGGQWAVNRLAAHALEPRVNMGMWGVRNISRRYTTDCPLGPGSEQREYRNNDSTIRQEIE